jgi:hypothetical protein
VPYIPGESRCQLEKPGVTLQSASYDQSDALLLQEEGLITKNPQWGKS